MLTLLFIILLATFSGCDINSNKTTTTDDGKPVITAIYDSRSIAVAYYNSSFNDNYHAELKKQFETADPKTKKQLEKQAEERQQLAHLQAFSDKPVDDLLEPFKSEIDTIITQNGATTLCSRWQYKGNFDNTVDITDEIVKLYNPSEKTLKTVSHMKDNPPVPQWKLKLMSAFH